MNRALILFAFLVLALFAMLFALREREPGPTAPRASAAAAIPEQPGLQTKPIHALRERNLSGATEYLVRNLVAGPIEVHCTATAAENLRPEPALPRTLVVDARAERLVTEWHVVDPALPSRAAIACAAMVGDPRARPPENLRYALPLPKGVDYTLDQGFDGRFSHHDAETRYALDFGVPEGTPVLAARAGVVMQVEEDFRASGTDVAVYGDRANYVRVLHEDGSMALYAHLAPKNLLSRPGDRVVAGQLLGKSGNTGLSTGPHLHFSVQRNAGMALRAIPFTIEGVDPRAARH